MSNQNTGRTTRRLTALLAMQIATTRSAVFICHDRDTAGRRAGQYHDLLGVLGIKATIGHRADAVVVSYGAMVDGNKLSYTVDTKFVSSNQLFGSKCDYVVGDVDDE